MKKEDLKPFDKITLRNGTVCILHENEDLVVIVDNDNCIYNDDLSYYDDDLRSEDRDQSDEDIVKVERPIAYNVIFKNNEIKKEMTIAEVEEQLGYEIKIVKEKNK